MASLDIQIMVSRILLCVVFSPLCICTGVPSLQDLCPYTTFCNGRSALSDHEFTGTGRMPCCLPCSCHDTCHMTGNCCPDKTPAELTDDRHYPCRQIDTYLNNYQNVHFNANSRFLFRIIDSCPDEVIHGNQSKSRCYGHAKVSELHFVSDKKSKHTYINKRCALCNGIKDIVKWDFNLKCGEMLDLAFTSSANREDTLLNSSCQVYAIPPKQEIGLLSYCIQNTISVCNATKLVPYFDPAVQRKCQSSKPLQVFRDYLMEPFANPYCMLCNQENLQRLSPVCEAIGFNIDLDRLSFYPLSAILLANSQIDIEEDVDTPSCENATSSQVLDPVTNTCVDLECPVATNPGNGECRKMVDALYGYSVNVKYKISEENISQTVDDNKVRAHILWKFIQQKFDNAGLECGLCMLSISPNGTVGFVTLMSKPGCDHVSLLRFIGSHSLDNKLDFRTKYGLYFKMSMDGDIEMRNYSYPYIRPYVCKFHATFTVQTIYCPTVSFESASLQMHGHGNNKVWLNSVNKLSHKLDNGRIKICLDDYKSIYERLYNPADTCLCFKTVNYLMLLGSTLYQLLKLGD